MEAGGVTFDPQRLGARVEPPEAGLRFDRPPGERLAVGDHPVTAQVADEANFQAEPVCVTLRVRRRAARIDWPEPAAVTWAEGGFVLTATQLAAQATPGAGALIYRPAPGHRLEPGTHALQVQAEANEVFEPASASVQLQVDRAPALIHWAAPGELAMVAGGVALGAEQLAARVDPPAAGIVYSLPQGHRLGVGRHAIEARIADPVHYRGDPVQVMLEVTRRTPVITWDEPSPVPWAPGGFVLGAAQLSARVTPGAADLVYEPPAGERLEPGPHTLVVHCAANEVFEAARHQVTLHVDRIPVKLGWNPPTPVQAAAGGFVLGSAQLCATAEPAQAPLAYEPRAGQLLKAGRHRLSVRLADPQHYEGEGIEVELRVDKRLPTLVWNAPDAQDAVGGTFTLTASQLDARVGPGGGALSYQPPLGQTLPPGEHELRVDAAETEVCHAASARVRFTVRKPRARLSWAAPAAVDYVDGGFTLGAAQLNASTVPPNVKLKYTPPLGTRLDAGVYTLKAEAEQADQVELAPLTVTLTVRRAAAQITWAEPAAAIAGVGAVFALAGAQLNAVRVKGESPLAYAPAAGTALAVGTHLLGVSHAQSANYGYADAHVRFNVYANAQGKNGYETLKGGGGFKPTTPLDATVRNNWDLDVDGVKTRSKDIMRRVQDMTGPELLTYMDGLTPNPADRQVQPGTYPNHMWKLPGGLQVRYKPLGDQFSNPGGNPATAVPMFCIEVLAPGVVGFSTGQNEIATKVSSGGELAPKGPGCTTIPGNNNDYKSGSVEATHLRCRQGRLAQVIQAPATVTLPHGLPLSPQALGVRLEPGNGAITLVPAAGTVLGVGANQPLTINAAASDRFDAATLAIQVTVEKARPRLQWERPADMVWATGGAELTAAQLNARADPDAMTANIVYAPPLGSKLAAGTHTVTATLAATASSEAAQLDQQLTVRPAPVVIHWADPAELIDPGEGVELPPQVLDARVEPPHLALVYTPPPGTRLRAGDHQLQVHSEGDPNCRQAVATVTLRVKAADH